MLGTYIRKASSAPKHCANTCCMAHPCIHMCCYRAKCESQARAINQTATWDNNTHITCHRALHTFPLDACRCLASSLTKVSVRPLNDVRAAACKSGMGSPSAAAHKGSLGAAVPPDEADAVDPDLALLTASTCMGDTHFTGWASHSDSDKMHSHVYGFSCGTRACLGKKT